MNVIFVSSEAVPYSKTGGLADVAGSLPRALREEGINVNLFLPMYKENAPNVFSYTGYGGGIDMGGRLIHYSVVKDDNGAHLIDCPELYDRESLYGIGKGGYTDNAIRFSFFCRAVIESSVAMGLEPQVFHINDWQTALVAVYLKTVYREMLPSARSVLTIHNLGYQGNFPPTAITVTGLPTHLYDSGSVEFYGNLSFLKAGLVYSDHLVSVSPSYAVEIQGDRHGFGMEGILRERSDSISGILNGLDYSTWDPDRDKLIPFNFNPSDMQGKDRCKKDFCANADFADPSLPLIGVVSRLAYQKGIDIIVEAGSELAELDANIAILGTGDMELENMLLALAYKHTGKVMVSAVHDEQTAHRVYAASDIFLMPSRYEPCGLSQLIAMRYGALPVAHATGGITDTVRDAFKVEGGTGFLFEKPEPGAMLECLRAALATYSDQEKWSAMLKRAMLADFSWERSALRYIELYEEVLA